MTVRLTILRGPRRGEVFEFTSDEITIGSGRNNHVVVQDNDVSPIHCRLMRVQEDYDIEDMGSKYGTFVSGQQIHRGWVLKNPSIIELGGQVAVEYRLTGTHELVTHSANNYILEAGNRGSQPCLVLMEEGTIHAAYLLRSEEISIGRALGNDIVITANDISRHHTRFIWQEGRFLLEDLESRNGTFLNGEPVKTVRTMHRNDVIRLGASTQLHYVYRSDLPPQWDPAKTGSNDYIQGADMGLTLPTDQRATTLAEGNALHKGELNDHILVAYAREDWQSIVAPLVLNLGDAKQKVWVDQYLRLGSEAWKKSVEQALIECCVLVMVISPKALESSTVHEQYRYFYNRDKPIIIVDYKPVPKIPLQLAKVSRIAYDSESPGKMFQQLIFELMQHRGRCGE
ncbi:MAG: FHA domain-containing protein [Phototrophicaceae bacterium]|jgi:pSer/pThr/pTyr-binding forkhead associated (FHA) protein